MAIEEEFGIDIPDKHAEGIVTVGMMYDYLKARISETPTQTCLTQRLFYKLRRALLTNFRLNRRDIRPETKLSDLMSTDEIEEGWPFLQLFIDLETPDFKKCREILGFKMSEEMLTMRSMTENLFALNAEKLLGDTDSDADIQIWTRLVEVIHTQLNVDRHEIVPGASFTRDLGLVESTAAATTTSALVHQPLCRLHASLSCILLRIRKLNS